MLLEQLDVVDVVWCTELLVGFGTRLDPVETVGAESARAMGVAEQVPEAMPDYDGPRIDGLLPLVTSLVAADARAAARRGGGYEDARDLRTGTGGAPVLGGGCVAAQGGGLPRDVCR